MKIEDGKNRDFFETNSDVDGQNFEIAIEKLIPFLECLKELEKKGVDVNLICDAVESINDRWSSFSGAIGYRLDYRDYCGVLRREKAIRNAFNLLCGLPPIFPDLHKKILQGKGLGPQIDSTILEFNQTLKSMKENIKACESLLQQYLNFLVLEQTFNWDGYTDKAELLSQDLASRLFIGEYIDVNKIRHWMKINERIKKCETIIESLGKKKFNLDETEKRKMFMAHENMKALKKKIELNQSTRGVWGPSIVTIVNELRRARFRSTDAYRKTAELLNLYFPDIYKDTNPEIVRQHYQYYKNR